MRLLLSTLLLSTLPLLADFYPATTTSTVVGVGKNTISLSKGLSAKGVSAIVVHDYGENLKAITKYVRYDSGTTATKLQNEPIEHKDLPSIKSQIRKGDQVIGGYLYNNILVLAPDASTYANVTKSADKYWIHPDLYAMFLSREGDQIPTKDNLQKFANEFQVGLIYIVQKGKAVLYDPISRRFVSEKKMRGLPVAGQFPFFMRLGEIESSWFSRKVKGEYYSTVGNLK